MARKTRKIKRSRSRKVRRVSRKSRSRRVSRKGGRKRRTKKRVSRKMKGGAESKTVSARKAETLNVPPSERPGYVAVPSGHGGHKFLRKAPEAPEVVARRLLLRARKNVELKDILAERDRLQRENVELKDILAENKANVELGRALRLRRDALLELQAKANPKK
jgi:hypothetical protein